MSKSKLSLEFLEIYSEEYVLANDKKILTPSDITYSKFVSDFYKFIGQRIHCDIQRDEEFRVLLPEVIGIGELGFSSPDSFLERGLCDKTFDLLSLVGVCDISSLGYKDVFIDSEVIGQKKCKLLSHSKFKVMTLASHLRDVQLTEAEGSSDKHTKSFIKRKKSMYRAMEQLEKYSFNYTEELGRGFEALPNYCLWIKDDRIIATDSTTLSKIRLDHFNEDLELYLSPKDELTEFEVKAIDNINNYFEGFKRYV